MTNAEIALPTRPVAAPGRIGQATAVEQSRAVAEVYAAVMIAREAPRDIQAAVRAMEQACQTPELANKAFYSVPRGGKTATDISIHLARELATCWGNIQSHVAELRRDDEYGQSEMQAVAWDLETNNRAANTFIQPHRRAGKNSDLLTDTQAIYETNANAGARRLRQCILAILPGWYVERAKILCRKTINDGGGKPLPQRVAEALRLFEDFNITEDDIARTLSRPSGRWTPADLGQLRITYESLVQGTITRDEAFPPQKLGGPDDAAPSARSERPAPATPVQTPAVNQDAPPLPQPAQTEQQVDQHPTDAPPSLMKQIVDAGRERGWTAAELTADFKSRAGGTDPANAPEKELRAYLDWLVKRPAREQSTDKPSKRMLDKLHAQLSELKVVDAERHETLSMLVGRTITSANQLSKDEVQKLVNQLENVLADKQPLTAMDALLAAAAENANPDDIA